MSSRNLIEFIIEKTRNTPKIFMAGSDIDYDSDIAFVENTIISMDNDISIFNIMRNIPLYNFSFINIKSKGNLKSLYNEISDDDKTEFADRFTKVIDSQTINRQSNKIITKIYERDNKQKKHFKMIFDALDLIQKMIEGKLNDDMLKQYAVIVDEIYTNKEFLADCIREYNYISKLKGSDAQLDVDSLVKQFNIDAIPRTRYILNALNSIKFYRIGNFKYFNFKFTDDNNVQHICKHGKITSSGNKTTLPGWSIVNHFYQMIGYTDIFKREFITEILESKRNMYYAFSLLPYDMKRDYALKVICSNLLNYIKSIESYKIFEDSLKNTSNSEIQHMIFKTIALIRTQDKEVIDKVKTYVIDIVELINIKYAQFPDTIYSELITYINNFSIDNNPDILEIMKLLNI